MVSTDFVKVHSKRLVTFCLITNLLDAGEKMQQLVVLRRSISIALMLPLVMLLQNCSGGSKSAISSESASAPSVSSASSVSSTSSASSASSASSTSSTSSTSSASSATPVAPTLSVSNQPSALTNKNDLNLSITVHTQVNTSVASVMCTLDDAAPVSCLNTFSKTGIADGSHTLTIQAKDSLNNVSSPFVLMWKIDVTPPVITFTQMPTSPTTATTANFAFNATDSSSIKLLECQLDSQAFQICASPQALTGLAVISHTFTVRATDLAGNQITKSATWVVQSMSSGSTGVIFTDDFESGSLNHTENGIKWASGASTSIVSNFGNSGTHSLKFHYTGGAAGSEAWAEQRFDLGKPYSELYLEWSAYYPTGSDGHGVKFVHRQQAPNNNKLLRLWRGDKTDGNDGYSQYFSKSGLSTSANGIISGDEQIYGEYGDTLSGVGTNGSTGNGPSGGVFNTFLTDAQRGRWLAIKIHIKVASAANNDGVIEIWRDGVLLFSATNLITYPTDKTGLGYDFGYLMGFANAGFDQDTDMYIDDFRISTSSSSGLSISQATLMNSTLSISGNNFGTKASSSPLAWNNFDSSTIGSTSAQNGFDTLNYIGPAPLPAITNTASLSGSNAISVNYPVQTGANRSVVENFIGVGKKISTTEVYNSFYGSLAQTSGSDELRLFKFWRAGSGVPYSGKPAANITFEGFNTLGFTSGCDESANDGTTDYRDPNLPSGAFPQPIALYQWNYYEFWYKLSTPGVADGGYKMWINGKLIINQDHQVTRPSGSTAVLEWIFLFNGGDYYANNAYRQWVDDYYLDTTQARVVITDSPVYSSSTKWSIQPISTWSAGSISASINRNGFSSGETGYIYVFDSIGNVNSSGYPVQL